jgi:hypothetical protein
MRALAERAPAHLPGWRFGLADCNRIAVEGPGSFYRMAGRALIGGLPAGQAERLPATSDELEVLVGQLLPPGGGICLMLDRFDALESAAYVALPANLRALRDAYKYRLVYVVASRRLLNPANELAELFFANTQFLGPLSRMDARWSAGQYAARRGATWPEAMFDWLVDVSWGYPSLLRAACEACVEMEAAGPVDFTRLAAHPAMQRRLAEFWLDQPGDDALRQSRLLGQPLLESARPQPAAPAQIIPAAPTAIQPQIELSLTAKEHALLAYFKAHPGDICAKDDLIRAVWPEDKLLVDGLRDDSLAQLVRRLRQKLADSPARILTAPGRGYRYLQN